MIRRWFAAAGLGAAALSVCLITKVGHDYASLSAPPRVGDLPLSVVVLDRNDRLLRAFTSQDDKWRLPVELAEIDPLYFRMLLAFEDKRFYEHGGFDALALARSALQSLRSGRIVSGGSTLTMQVARLLEEQPTKSLERKYEQLLRAVQLEAEFSKEDILRLYALRAPFGGNLEGSGGKPYLVRQGTWASHAGGNCAAGGIAAKPGGAAAGPFSRAGAQGPQPCLAPGSSGWCPW